MFIHQTVCNVMYVSNSKFEIVTGGRGGVLEEREVRRRLMCWEQAGQNIPDDDDAKQVHQYFGRSPLLQSFAHCTDF